MSIPLEVVDRYARTFFDMWRLGPRQFLLTQQNSPGTYLSAYQFLVVSLGLILAMTIPAISLSQAEFKDVGDAISTALDPKALASLSIVVLIVELGINSFLYYLCARLPPVRTRPSMSALFEVNCYLLSTAIPITAISSLVMPFVAAFAAYHLVPVWTLFIPSGLSLLLGLVLFFVYTNPGMAYVSGVSSARMLAALALLWVIAGLLGVLLGGFAAVLIAYLS